MADLSITTTSVFPGSSSIKENGVAGETLANGKTVYKKASDGKYWLADSNAATAEARVPVGIVLSGGAANQGVLILKSGHITIGATVVQGTAYFQSDAPGGICPEADVGSGEQPTLIGFAISTTVINVDFQSAGVLK